MDVDAVLRKKLRLALLDSFPVIDHLRIVVEDVLGEPLQNISMANDMPAVIFQLIGWARARGRLTELVLGAAAEMPTNENLRAVAEQFRFLRDRGGIPERILLDSVPFENAAQWLDKMTRLRRAICRFEPQPEYVSLTGYGTAFLVAPDVIMTNFHVANDLRDTSEAIVRFDYEIDLAGNVQAGHEVKLAKTWRLASSEALDYALVRLAHNATALNGPNTGRDHIRLERHEFKQNEPVVILQHPMGSPLKFAFGTIVSVTDGHGVTYNANTEPGSSGSPVMTSSLRTVALHHQGQTRTNRAIRAALILDHLAATNNMGLLAP